MAFWFSCEKMQDAEACWNGGKVALKVTREWAERWSGLVTNATAMTNAAWRKKLAAIKQAA